MLQNYLKTALRKMGRQKVYTFINISGLAIGMAACILILLWVKDELSYDAYHDNSDQIYRLSRQWFNEDGESNLHLGHLAPPFAPLLKNDMEGVVDEAVRFLGDTPGPLLTFSGDKKLVEEKFFFADPQIFKVFSWKIIEGDPETALVEPNSLVITQSTAKKYFGEESAIGQTINYQNMMDMKVTAVIEDVPLNSHFTFNTLCSFATVENFFGIENLMQQWGSNNYATYILLEKGKTKEDLAALIPGFLDKHLGERNGHKASETNALNIWPLTSIHLHSHLDSEIEANGDISYVYIFSIVALLILLIACINFVNLSTARSSTRAKEVGLRKVIGAQRSNLIRQFLAESLITAFLALIVAVLLVEILLPSFNSYFFKDLHMDYFSNPFTIPFLLGITILVGLVAGSYPAFYLSRFKPVTILRGKVGISGKKSPFRSGLVVLQFAISIMLIVGVSVVQDQMKFIQNKPLGFDKENVVILPSNDEIYGKFESLKTQWLSQPGISDVTMASRMPSGRLLDSQGCRVEVDGEMKEINFRIADVHVSHDYLSTFGVEIIAGRDFDIRLTSDSTQSFILNEAAIKAIGWESADQAVGKKIAYGGRSGTVIGVTGDFHFENLRQKIAPVIFLITSGRARFMAFRIHEGAREEALSYLESQWEFLRPGFPFTYEFVTQRFDSQYEEESRLGEVIGYFSMLAVIIAILGLFGLASFTTEQRFREIGIRKVLGASVSQILLLLTRGFTVLVMIAFIIAAPISWYLLSEYFLSNFAYATNVSMLSVVLAGVIALVIAWFTVAFNSYKAATTNPVKAIRQE
ncbi:MAG: ABC transporter permease [Bacteroidetes bacterium]|nr:ABC transporter permease [Bacteroidota bacterium]